MDAGHGAFIPLAEPIAADLQQLAETVPHLFRIGQEVTVNGSRFRVQKIARKRLVLRLLPIVEEPHG